MASKVRFESDAATFTNELCRRAWAQSISDWMLQGVPDSVNVASQARRRPSGRRRETLFLCGLATCGEASTSQPRIRCASRGLS
jgi:hypothetical protein